MCVNSLSQGLNVDLPKAGLEPRTSRSESRASTTTPRRHTVYAERNYPSIHPDTNTRMTVFTAYPCECGEIISPHTVAPLDSESVIPPTF
ncbi:hypothetical protein ElyMa_006918100 [Elysia marginata]|uniref:Uncharacterized protein n=1 Tax=Elysia marginata TaxID=1093978 RepID=A0AAV4JFP4_9GAST|nr:hypothetical protein ElyMa_006918100 [Elysia marginata]